MECIARFDCSLIDREIMWNIHNRPGAIVKLRGGKLIIGIKRWYASSIPASIGSLGGVATVYRSTGALHVSTSMITLPTTCLELPGKTLRLVAPCCGTVFRGKPSAKSPTYEQATR